VEIVTYTMDDVPEGSLLLEAAVATPDNMECEALIVLEVGVPPESCEIIPSNVNNPPSGSVEEFDLFCDGLPCTGTVTWDEEDGGDNIADVIASDQLGATAQVVTYTEPDELSGYMLLEAMIGFPDNMICNATITLNHDGPPDDDDCGLRCDVYPSPQLGAPGSHHHFDLQCIDDESDDWYPCGADTWTLTEGEEYVVLPWTTYGDQWADVDLISSFIIEEETEIVEIEAFVDHGEDCTARCDGRIELPPMDCYDYI